MVAGSPVLPLPVEFVAGGEGSPDLIDPTLECGLEGSGRSGRPAGGVPSIKLAYAEAEWERSWMLGLGPFPMKTADTGRPCLILIAGRGGIYEEPARRMWSVLFF